MRKSKNVTLVNECGKLTFPAYMKHNTKPPLVPASRHSLNEKQLLKRQLRLVRSPFIIPQCPPATCACRSTPEDIRLDSSRSALAGTVAPYTTHISVHTSHTDWPSRITDGPDGWAAEALKNVFREPLNHFTRSHSAARDRVTREAVRSASLAQKVQDDSPLRLLITHTSMSPSIEAGDTEVRKANHLSKSFRQPIVLHTASVCFTLFPHHLSCRVSMQWLLRERLQKPLLLDQVRHYFARIIARILSGKVERKKEFLMSADYSRLNEDIAGTDKLYPYHVISAKVLARWIVEPVVLICGHGARDERCGTMGPLLEQEFKDQLKSNNIKIETAVSESLRARRRLETRAVRLGLTSHIGGHKFAGNVIIYISPWQVNHPLAGMGIWYGRVEPKHVEGIVKETVIKGNVIWELFRGGINSEGKQLSGGDFGKFDTNWNAHESSL